MITAETFWLLAELALARERRLNPDPPTDTAQCPACGAVGPYTHTGPDRRHHYNLAHLPYCFLYRERGTSPRDETGYLDGAATPFERSDYTS